MKQGTPPPYCFTKTQVTAEQFTLKCINFFINLHNWLQLKAFKANNNRRNDHEVHEHPHGLSVLVSSPWLLKKKYPTTNPRTKAMKTPPLKDIAANMSKYPSPAFSPKTADSNTLNPTALGFRPISGVVRPEEGLTLETPLKRDRRLTIYSWNTEKRNKAIRVSE